MTFTSTTVTATAISTATASSPSITTLLLVLSVFFTAPSTSSGNSLAATVAGGEVIASRR